MKNLIVLIIIVFFIASCKKDDDKGDNTEIEKVVLKEVEDDSLTVTSELIDSTGRVTHNRVFLDMEIDKQKNVHVVYLIDKINVKYATKKLSDTVWTYSVIEDPDRPEGVDLVHFTLDNDDGLHTVYRIHARYLQHLYKKAGDTNWQLNKIELESDEYFVDMNDLAIAIDAQNNLHIVYADNVDGLKPAHLYQEAGIWKKEYIEQQKDLGGDMAVAIKDDMIYAVYGGKYELKYAEKKLTETTWNTKIIVGTLNESSEKIAAQIAVDNNQTSHIFYADRNYFSYQYAIYNSTIDTFSVQTVNENYMGYGTSIVFENDTLHISYASKEYNIKYAVKKPEYVWAEYEIKKTGTFLEYTDIILVDGQIYICYTQNDEIEYNVFFEKLDLIKKTENNPQTDTTQTDTINKKKYYRD